MDARSALKEFPEELRGRKPQGAPHSPWQLLEHLRIAQHDILRFSVDPDHTSPKWPDEYWPKKEAPASDHEWKESVRKFLADLNAMCELVSDPQRDLFARIPHGEGQTLLREALLLADHNAYHIGQFIMVRRTLEEM